LKRKTVADAAKEQGKPPIDFMLDLSVEEDLKTEFALLDFINNNEETLAQIIKHPDLDRFFRRRGAYQVLDVRPPYHLFSRPLGARQSRDIVGGSPLVLVDYGGLGDWHQGSRLAERRYGSGPRDL